MNLKKITALRLLDIFKQAMSNYRRKRILLRIFTAECEPGEPRKQSLDDRDGKIGPGELGEGGGKGEDDNHHGKAEPEDDGVVGDDGDGVDGVAVEQINGLWQDGENHDAGEVGRYDITLGKEQARQETRKDIEECRHEHRGS